MSTSEEERLDWIGSLSASHTTRRKLLRSLCSLLTSGASLLVLAGLIATPASCSCGADIPHAHSLLTLAGHHHNASGAPVRLHQAPGPGTPSVGRAAIPDSLPRLANLTGHGSNLVAVALAAVLSMTLIWRRLVLRYPEFLAKTGRIEQPDPPPPRMSCFT